MLRLAIVMLLSLNIHAHAEEQTTPDEIIQQEGERIGNFCSGKNITDESDVLSRCVNQQCSQIFRNDKSFAKCRSIALEKVQIEIEKENASIERQAEMPISEPLSPEALIKKNCARDLPEDTAKQNNCYNKQAAALKKVNAMLAQYPEGSVEDEILIQCGIESQDRGAVDFVKQEQCAVTQIESYNRAKKEQELQQQKELEELEEEPKPE